MAGGLSAKDRRLVQQMIDATMEYLSAQHQLSLEDGLDLISVVITIVGISVNVEGDSAAAQEIGMMAGAAVKAKLEATGHPGNVRVINHVLETDLAPIVD